MRDRPAEVGEDDRMPGSLLDMDDRAVSVTVGYVLTLAIGAVLLGGIAVGIGGAIDAQTDRAVHGDLSVVGQQVVANLESADRLARSAEEGRNDTDPDVDGSAAVTVAIDLPTRVSGTSYTVDIDGDAVVLRTERPDASVRIPHTARIDVSETRVRGGPLRIEYNSEPGPSTLEVSER